MTVRPLRTGTNWRQASDESDDVEAATSSRRGAFQDRGFKRTRAALAGVVIVGMGLAAAAVAQTRSPTVDVADEAPKPGGSEESPMRETQRGAASTGLRVTAGGLLIGPAGGGGPVQLCSMALTSLPPGCGQGILVEGIDDVAQLDGAETSMGKAWGDFRLDGIYRDGVLKITEPPVAYDPPDRTRHYPGGMVATDYSDELAELRRYVAEHPDTYVGWWFDLWERNVLVVAFTEDHEQHEAAIAEFWSYGLKVVDRPYTAAELEAKADEVREPWLRGELDILTMAVEEDEGYVHLSILIADEETVSDYHRRFGSELIRIIGWLKPVEKEHD
ncbi:MAG: hypothetical protein ACRDUY_00420 [Nitriliruptorales bacterium]